MDKYRTLSRRFFATSIDTLVTIPIGFLNDGVQQLNPPQAVLYVWFFITSFAFSFYFILMHGFYGQTLGKMITKVKVLDVSENPITFRQSFLREAPNLALTFLLFFSPSLRLFLDQNGDFDFLANPIGNIIYILWVVWGISDAVTTLFNDKTRALHDYIAGTVVVKTNL